MNDLRKAAEMALEALMQRGEHHPKVYQAAEALRQALDDRPLVKTYAGGKPNYCTPKQGNNSPNYPISESSTPFVDAVNMSQDRVDETAKSEHEPFIYIRADTEMPFGGYEHCGQHDPGAFPVYLAPPKKKWVGLTDQEIENLWNQHESRFDHYSFSCDIEAKLKEKNT